MRCGSIWLVAAALVALPTFWAQDLFEPSTNANADGWVDHFWKEAASSKLRGDGVTLASAPRQLAAADRSLVLQVTVYGFLGEEVDRVSCADGSACRTARETTAKQWLFPVLLKIMFRDRVNRPDNQMSYADLGAMGKAPEVTIQKIPAFHLDPALTDDKGVAHDQRSPMERTHFTIRFFNLEESKAKKFASNFCNDFNEAPDTILQGLLRAFEQAAIYPHMGFDAATSAGSGMRSFMNINSFAEEIGKKPRIFECYPNQARPGSGLGAFLLPACPDKSAKCEDIPGLCAEPENTKKPYLCKCLLGYNGDKMKLTGFEDPLHPSPKGFHYSGKCDKIMHYCPAKSLTGYAMEAEDADGKRMVALGEAGEDAWPGCPDGYFNTGASKCMPTGRKAGQWLPPSSCKFDPPKEPTIPDCEAPKADDKTVVATNCGRCRANSPFYLHASENNCKCDIACAKDYKDVSGNGEGRKTCVDKDFPCPSGVLTWKADAPQGTRCVNAAGEATADNCCKGRGEAWGPNAPTVLKTTGNCRDLQKDDVCLTNQQAIGGSNVPCCWNDKGFTMGQNTRCVALNDKQMINGRFQPQACAVPDRVPGAAWEGFPKCKPICPNNFDVYPMTLSLEATGCDKCIAGETAPGCGCQVKCKGELSWYGGAKEGPQTCTSLDKGFTKAPVCMKPQETLQCEMLMDGADGRTVKGCGRCKAGKNCDCIVECQSGYQLSGGTAGAKKCIDVVADLAQAKCEDITEEKQCLKSRSNAGPIAPLTESPCCWREEGFGAGGTKCIQKGSDLITTDAVPNACAHTRQAKWESPTQKLPTCERECSNIFTGENVEFVGNCANCIPGEGGCTCEVKCKKGAVRVGGGGLGKRTCASIVGKGPSFGMPPICLGPDLSGGDEREFIAGTTERPGRCAIPLSGTGDGRKISGCYSGGGLFHNKAQCSAVGKTAPATGCDCEVGCLETHLERAGSTGAKGAKKCIQTPNALTQGSCTDLTTEDDCMSQKAGDGEPCCWLLSGFDAAGGGAKCAGRGSADINRVPSKCANTLKAEWEPFPTCDKRCKNIFLHTSALQPSAGCADCVSSDAPGAQPCDCQVKCEDGLVRVGGGVEGARTCSKDVQKDPNEPIFEAAPVCLEREKTPEAIPSCAEPENEDGALELTTCDACTAGDQACTCKVTCHKGYKVQGTAGNTGARQCKKIDAPLNSVDCTTVSDRAQCLGGKDSASGKACCWQDDGFLKNFKRDPSLKCAPSGSDRYIGTDELGRPTTPSECAASFAFKWEVMPKCVKLCSNKFKGALNVVETGCDSCFVSQLNAAGQCQCDVQCSAKSTLHNGGGKVGPRKCSATGAYGSLPRCVAEEGPPAHPSCAFPDDALGALDVADECSECVAGQSCASCSVNCASGYKYIGGGPEGIPKCAESVFPCPAQVVFDFNDRKCNNVNGQPTEYYCCADAWPGRSGGDKPRVLVANWPALPTCEEKCKDVFSPEKTLGAQIEITGDCSSCVISGHGGCNCKVQCKPGYVRVGGGDVGGRTCKGQTNAAGKSLPAFGLPPVCILEEKKPRCDEPHAPGALVQGCDCRADDTACACKVACGSESVNINSNKEGDKKCKSETRNLVVKSCASIGDRAQCLESRDSGSQQPCCWGGNGLDAGGGKKCLATGSSEMQKTPEKCARTFDFKWEPMPFCKGKCVNTFAASLDTALDYTKECDKCIAGEDCPLCRVSCKPPYQRIGGGSEGTRKCSIAKPTLEGPPVCVKIVSCGDPTLCGPGDPSAPKCIPPLAEGDAVRVTGCKECRPGRPCDDGGCKIECGANFISANAVATAANCNWVEVADVVSKACGSIFDEGTCLSSKEGALPCCWRGQGLHAAGGGPKCAVQGSSDIQVVPQCAALFESKWETLPACEAQCQSDLQAIPNLEFNQDACAKCWGKGQAACKDCNVQCKAGFQRFGGGMPGARFCPPTKIAEGASEFQFEEAPVCMEIPPTPKCEDVAELAVSPSFVTSNCGNCVAGQDCNCNVNCAPGFHLIGGSPGRKQCLNQDKKDLKTTGSCSGLKTLEDCLLSQQVGGLFGGKKGACCFRRAGFMKGTPSETVCARKLSSKIRANTPPDSCALLHEAVWKDLPQCSPYCSNAFKDLTHIDKNLARCDSCIMDGQGKHGCSCELKCAPGSKRIPSGPKEGIKTCKATDDPLKPRFEPAPQCEPFCAPPSSNQGTLDVSGCKDDCFPGQACSCKVKCMQSTQVGGTSYWRGGGSEGTQTCKSTENAAVYTNLPDCNPVCEKPDDQYRTMDVSKCQTRCQAGDKSCKCSVKCHGSHVDKPGEGHQGEKFCKLIPGNDKVPARGRWVNANPGTWSQVGHDVMPSCLAPLNVKVVDAQNQKPLNNIKIEVSDVDDRTLPAVSETTNSNGVMVIHTAIRNLMFKVNPGGGGQNPLYNTASKKINRVKYCTVPTNCEVQIAISKKLDSGDIHSPGCFFTASKGKVSWQMRATLQWNDKPADLDIWVRNVECSESARTRYECWSEGEPQWVLNDDTCKRWKFSTRRGYTIMKQEQKVCRTMECETEDDPVATKFRPGRGGTPEPKCYTVFKNQFPKWVFWDSRYIDNIEKKMDKYGYVTSVDPGWTGVKNWIVLDVDQRKGRGPETVTLNNVPPGTYQVAVDLFSKEESSDVRDGDPEVTLTMGGNAVTFICKIPRSCTDQQGVWNVLEVKVTRNGKHTDEHTGKAEDKFDIKILDQRGSMTKIRSVNLPASSIPARVGRWIKTKSFWSSEVTVSQVMEDYFNAAVDSYTDVQLDRACHGQCELAEQTFEGHKDCLMRNR